MAHKITIKTPLGDKLLFRSMTFNERLGGLFQGDLELLSMDDSISPDDILGKDVTVTLEMQDAKKRHFHGFVARFGQAGWVSFGKKRYTLFRAQIVPGMWFM